MKIPASREVLAFYSSEEGEQADRAYQSLRRSGSDACIVAGDTDPPTESCRFYAELRLEGEHLVTVPTEPSKIGNVVKTFRHAGTPSIFVIRPGVPVPRARTVRPVAAPRTRREILASLDAEKKTLDAARRDLREATRLDHALPSAAEWILDNSYLIRTQNAEVRRHLPRDLDRWITPGDGKRGVPALARELVKQCSFALTEANIRDFLRGHQAPVPLTIAELWAFPLFLRIALIEELDRKSVV